MSSAEDFGYGAGDPSGTVLRLLKRAGPLLPSECIDSEEFLQPFFLCEPPKQVRFFITVFCLSIAFGVALHHPPAARFYNRLVKSRLTPDQRRGLGYTACKAYGLFPICRLSEGMFRLVGALLVASLVLACHPHLAPRFFLFASFFFYFLYFGQLYCESKHGGHGALLLPSVLLLLALSGGPQDAPWSLVFIKLFLGVVYFAGAVSKAVISWGFFRRPWLGSTMQAYIFDAMWSRPHSMPIVRRLQEIILTRWWLCTGMAVSGLVFEFGWLPLVLLGGPSGGVLAAFVAVSFHLGVDVLQGLDFKPFWLPVFWAFLPDAQTLWHGQEATGNEGWQAVLLQGFEESPCRWLMSAGYIFLQVAVSFSLMDCHEGKECLPLRCCPMFAVPRNIFADEVRGGVMLDADLREGGHVDVAYNFYPWHSDLPATQEDLQQIPGRVLFWMSTRHCHPLLTRLVKPEFLDRELLVHANFEVTQECLSKLAELAGFLEQASSRDWSDARQVAKALALQAECRQLFEASSSSYLEPKCQLKELRDSWNFLSKIDLSWLLLFGPTEDHPYITGNA